MAIRVGYWWLLASLVPMLASARPWDDEACPYTTAQIARMDIDTSWSLLGDFDCPALEPAIAARVDQLIRTGIRPADVDPEEFDEARQLIDMILLRGSLEARDLFDARERLHALAMDVEREESALLAKRASRPGTRDDGPEAGAAPGQDPGQAAWEATQSEAEQEGRTQARARWASIAAILDGAAPPVRTAIAAPTADWTLQFGGCGTPAMMFAFQALRVPGEADAWLAVGRPEIALQSLIAEQWILAVSLGMAPPRLRELADRAIGNSRYEAEVDAALAAIRIEPRPDGRYASMPLFGIVVPLPLGVKSWRDEQSTTFTDAGQIAAYLRPKLLAAANDED